MRPPSPTTYNHSPVTRFFIVLRKVGRETDYSEMIVIRDMGPVILYGPCLHIRQDKAKERRSAYLIHMVVERVFS